MFTLSVRVVQVTNAFRTISVFSETEKHIGLTLLCLDKKFSGTTSLTLNFLRDFYNFTILCFHFSKSLMLGKSA